jgi:CRISPR-associated endonuclease/helicase Cas3
VFGAALAYFVGGAPDAAFVIAGHHAGMPDPVPLRERLHKVQPDIHSLLDVAVRDCPEVAQCFSQGDGLLDRLDGDGLQIDCATRVLFSCLIDADRMDAARHAGLEIASPERLNAGERLQGVLRMSAEKARTVADGPVKSARAEVLEACLAAAGRPGPLFSLTVPTGGAKTLASTAFALRRAELFPEKVRRVIVVIPFLSIIEQNAQVYREAMGEGSVIEHHSGIWGSGREERDDYESPGLRLATENWNAPVIVTTSVRFFEALFSNKPKDLRRMHNLARSVVILDEVQTLPRERVGPILSMMRSLAEDWGTTFVFCTATQPAFEKRADAKADPRWITGTVDEIIPEPKKLFAELRRVEVRWPAQGEKKTWDALAEEVMGEKQALIVVNTRGHALKLFRRLAPVGSHVLHLSNNMCPAHRLARLDQIRERLKRAEDCVVVSTQLVEAGVDLDFPAVWRAMGPLDSIAQAAGRCDREGRLTMDLGRPGGRVVVFQPEEDQMPGGAYSEAAGITAALAAGGQISIDDPNLIRAYFDRYYDLEALDADHIDESRRSLQFKTVADSFRMIEDNSLSVIIPLDESAEEMLRDLQFGALSVLRRLQRYTVNLWESDFRKAVALGAIFQVIEGQDTWAARPGFYDAQTGLLVNPDSAQLVV